MEGLNRPHQPTINKSKRAQDSVQRRPTRTSGPGTEDFSTATKRTHNTRSKNLPCSAGLEDKPRERQVSRARAKSASQSSAYASLFQWNNLIPSVEVNTDSNNSLRTESVARSSISEDSNTYDLLQTGLAFPINDRESQLVELVLRYSEMFAKIVENRKDIASELENSRNVNLQPSEVRDTFDFQGLQSQLPDDCEAHLQNSHYQDKVWNFDKVNCEGEDEFIFQRTLMMTMIDRFRFFPAKKGPAKERPENEEKEKDWFTFSTEQNWYCPLMPTRGLTPGNQAPKVLSLPKPDLCVCFRTTAVLTKACSRGLSPAMRRMINVEGQGKLQQERAFPFMTLEAKNGRTMDSDDTALYQSLNAASQALHNMYEFFREAKMESSFFKVVRYFTITATASGCTFRMHRAIDMESELAGQIVPEYRLKFEYDEIGSLRGEQYTRQAVLKLSEKIIWAYGPVLRDQLKKVSSQLEAIMGSEGYDGKLSNRPEYHYRHRQSHVSCRNKSVAPSEARDSQVSQRGVGQPEPTPARSNSTRNTSVASRNTPRASYITVVRQSFVREGSQRNSHDRRRKKRRDKDFEDSGEQEDEVDEEDILAANFSFDREKKKQRVGDIDAGFDFRLADHSPSSQRKSSGKSKRQRHSPA